MLPILGPLPGRRDNSPVPHRKVLQRYNAWLTENGYTRFIDFESYVETLTRFMFIECACDRLPWTYSLPSRDSTMLRYFDQFIAPHSPAPSTRNTKAKPPKK